jgi:hypothetical protein
MLTIDFTPLTVKDIKIGEAIDKISVEIYKDALYQVMQPLFDLKEYELTIYAKAVRDNSKQEFDRLPRIATLYKQAGDNALSITAPRDISAVHLDIINSLYRFSVILNELAKGYDDPAASLSGVANFTQAESQFGNAFDNLKTYFVLKKVYDTSINI